MEQVKVVRWYMSDKKKDGTPFKDKKGNPFWKVAIKVEAQDVPADVWLSKLCFKQDDPAMKLKDGDEVEIKVWQENGYWNFDFPKKEDIIEETLSSILDRLEAIEQDIDALKQGKGASLGAMVREMKKDDDVKMEDLPF